MTARIATTELAVGGVRLAPGEQVVVVVAAANRDPEVFADPEALDVGRPDNRHLSFSVRMHYFVLRGLRSLELRLS